MRALVLSGGGVKGAYQAGALRYIMANQRYTYDLYTGTSVGALNAAFLAQFGSGHDAEGANKLYELWVGIKPSHVYKLWYKGVLWYLPALWKESVYSSDPLRDLIQNHVSPERLKTSGKKLRIAAVSATTYEGYTWTEQDDDIGTGVLASSAFPGVFPRVPARGDLWMDGVVHDNTPLAAAIYAGATEIDVICCNPAKPALRGNTTIHHGVHVLNMLIAENDRMDLDAAERYNLLVDAGYAGRSKVSLRVLRPTVDNIDKHPFDFRPEVVSKFLVQGYEDAVNWTKGQR